MSTRLGISLASFAVFFFEIVCANFLGFSLGSGYVLVVIPLAMMGISVAGSALSCVGGEAGGAARRPAWPGALCLLLVAAFFGVYVVNSIVLGRVDADVSRFLALTATSFPYVAAAMFLPYFLFGALVALIFRDCRRQDFTAVYFFDMAGGALGCVAAYLVMQAGWFQVAMALPSYAALLAALCFVPRLPSGRRRFLGAAAAAGVLLAAGMPLLGRLEPRPNLDLLARNVDRSARVSEIWSGWNAYSRVGGVEVTSPGGAGAYRLMLGNGEGQATLHEYVPDDPAVVGQVHAAQLVSLLAPAPDDVLVLMAGAGADMLAIDKLTGGRARITGVELNNNIARAATELRRFNLEAFFRKPGVRYVVDEARAFLERDRERYDVVLSSFSGATFAYYAGSMGQTTQFVYTVEALRAMLARVKADGGLVVLNTNKVRLLANLREALDGTDRSAERAVIVLGNPGTPSSRWQAAWDENRVLIRPAGFGSVEAGAIAARAAAIGLDVLYRPDTGAAPGYEVYEEILKAVDHREFVARLTKQTRLDFAPAFDDRPFIFNLQGRDRWLDRDFLARAFVTAARARNPDLNRLFVSIVIGLIGLVLIVGPLALKSGVRPGLAARDHFAFFAALGAGFMLVEIGLVHKLGLLVGDPGLTLALVLGGIVLFTGVGSLTGGDKTSPYALRMSVFLLVAYLAGFVLLGDSVIRALLRYDVSVRVIAALVVVAMPSILMGRFMPHGLRLCREDDPRLINWGWAVNGATGTFVACIGPVMAQLAGFKAMLVGGALCYSAIVLLPRYRGLGWGLGESRRRVVEAGDPAGAIAEPGRP